MSRIIAWDAVEAMITRTVIARHPEPVSKRELRAVVGKDAWLERGLKVAIERGVVRRLTDARPGSLGALFAAGPRAIASEAAE